MCAGSGASKPATLVVAEKVKGKEWGKWGPPLVEALAAEVRKLMGAELGKDEDDRPHAVRAVGVIVNRVRPQDLDEKARQDLLEGRADPTAIAKALTAAGLDADEATVDTLHRILAQACRLSLS